MVDKYQGTDETLCCLQSSLALAQNYRLDGLCRTIPDVSGALVGNDQETLQTVCMPLFRKDAPQLAAQLSKGECRKLLQEYSTSLLRALTVLASHESQVIKKQAGVDADCQTMVTILAPPESFDVGHAMHQLQATIVGDHSATTLRKLQAFARQDPNPIDTFLRHQEAGYDQARLQLRDNSQDAEEVNEAGKKAFQAQNYWTAELYWKRATELSDRKVAKYFTNLACVRIRLGRYLRSYQLGYRTLGHDMLQAAVQDAKTAVELDRGLERGYQRQVEALLARGRYEHAMEAYRVIRTALTKIDTPSPRLLDLERTAKTHARLWLPVASAPTIPAKLHAALCHLRRVVVESWAAHDDTEVLQVAGDRIVDGVFTVRAVVYLFYTEYATWQRQKKPSVGN